MDDKTLIENVEQTIFFCPKCAATQFALQGEGEYNCTGCGQPILVSFAWDVDGSFIRVQVKEDQPLDEEDESLLTKAETRLKAIVAHKKALEYAQTIMEMAIQEILTKEQKEYIKKIKANHEFYDRGHNEIMDWLEKDAIEFTLAVGKTVHAPGYMAVFTPPGTKYDPKKLEGYAAAHPDLKALAEVVPAKITLRKGK